jgi:hypothetical protein
MVNCGQLHTVPLHVAVPDDFPFVVSLLQVSVVGRFNTWSTTHGPFTGKVGALRRLRPDPAAVTVKDMAGFLEAMHLFAIHHYLTVCQG